MKYEIELRDDQFNSFVRWLQQGNGLCQQIVHQLFHQPPKKEEPITSSEVFKELMGTFDRLAVYAEKYGFPPKKEEPKEAIPHIHPHGISDCQFCAPTLTVNWKLTGHDHREGLRCPVPFCGFNSKTERLEQILGENIKKYLDEHYPELPKESDPELALTVGQMKELFDNLVMEGFTKGEAAQVVGIVARG